MSYIVNNITLLNTKRLPWHIRRATTNFCNTGQHMEQNSKWLQETNRE